MAQRFLLWSVRDLPSTDARRESVSPHSVSGMRSKGATAVCSERACDTAIMLADDSCCWMGLSWLEAGARRDVGVHRDLRSLVRKAFLQAPITRARRPGDRGITSGRSTSSELPSQSQLWRAEETYAKRGKRGQPPSHAARSRGGAVEAASVGGRVVLVGGLVEDGLGRARPAPGQGQR